MGDRMVLSKGDAVTSRRPPVAPATTTNEDVEMAYRVLLGRPPAGDDLARLRLVARSLRELRRRIMASEEMASAGRRRVSGATILDENLVRHAYRLIRFEEIPSAKAREMAARGGTLLDLVDRLVVSADRERLDEAAAPRASREVVLLHGESMPRSGHHLLANMLCEYFEERLAYCEFYSVWDCCGAQPCQRPLHPLLRNRLLLQKSHDLQFADPVNRSGTYLIQYRHPIPRLQSNFDHSLHVLGGEDTLERFRNFAAAETGYYIRFWQKWIDRPPRNGIVLTYEQLAEFPRQSLERVVSQVVPDESIDSAGIERALATLHFPSGSSPIRSGAVLPRKMRTYRHYDDALYREVEERVFAACPGLAFQRFWT